MVSSGVRALDEAFAGLDLPVEDHDCAFPSAEQLMELSLSSCPDNGSEEYDEEGMAPRRCFSFKMRR